MAELEREIEGLSERKRRAYHRYMDKLNGKKKKKKQQVQEKNDGKDENPAAMNSKNDNRPYPPILPLDIMTNGILKLMTTLDTNKATGPDQIPALILKSCAPVLAPILQSIFSQSLASFTLPNDWLYANIDPPLQDSRQN
ncbi:putative RNA-directed DNA polymerase from mobile element jockey-like [Penaeus vannamei]|uniref:Putative RNA-directed DNA polymerase from mobile element jockey-like n=1 Tax=Penaeus vannamei TaxID=6689 RepID=A0A3R7PY24_PENVA|nr:putative RNA-directed DNA polymerase from mobile element jockey-like [Penaeus vannamei]